MRCPIVATNVGGVPEVVLDGETGILVPPRDPVQLARGIIRLFKRPSSLAFQMAECGYQRLKACFDVRETVSKTEHLYKELLRERGNCVEMSIKENLEQVKQNIANAAVKAGKRPEDIVLVMATKTVDTERIREAIKAGGRIIGRK